MVTLHDVSAAAGRVDGHVRRTPTLRLESGALGPAVPIVAKLDVLQPTGSFKVRGAVSLLTTLPPGDEPVVAASGGNFGLAVAWAASRLARRAVIVVPSTTPADKLAHLAALDADVEVVPGVYADALHRAQQRQAETSGTWAHAYDQPEVVAGQGTAALELLADHPQLTTIVVACGGGGLLAGTVAAAGDRRVVAVETTGTATLQAALAAGHPIDVEVSGLAASSLGARRIGDHAWAVRDHIDAVLVEDAAVVAAQRRLWSATRLVTEPGGATALAGLIDGAVTIDPDERVGVIVCGANTDPVSVVG